MSVFTTDEQRAIAKALRLLLQQIEGQRGEDAALGADILDAVGAPTTIGCPIGTTDGALNLAGWLKQDRLDALIAGMRVVIDAIKRGDKCNMLIQAHDIARAITAVAIRVHIAKLEGAPA